MIVLGDPGPSPFADVRSPVARVAAFVGVLLLAGIAWSMLAVLPWQVLAVALVAVASWLLLRARR